MIETKLHNEIKEYCKLNNLKVNTFINELLKKAFIREKYGDTPFGNKPPISTKVEAEMKKDEVPIIDDNIQISETHSTTEVVENENVTPEQPILVEDIFKHEENVKPLTKTKKRKLN